MLAMVVNDNDGCLMPRGVLEFIASMLAPTGKCGHIKASLRLRHSAAAERFGMLSPDRSLAYSKADRKKSELIWHSDTQIY
jgi:hypothetical protein